MLRSDAKLNQYGFTTAQWEAAKPEAKAALAEYAKRGHTVAYSDFAKKLHSIVLEHRDPRLFHFLGEISAEEDAAGRGMLTALVVHKHGDMKPGPGFFELAEKLGRKATDMDNFWIDDLNKVSAVWRKRKRAYLAARPVRTREEATAFSKRPRARAGGRGHELALALDPNVLSGSHNARSRSDRGCVKTRGEIFVLGPHISERIQIAAKVESTCNQHCSSEIRVGKSFCANRRFDVFTQPRPYTATC